MMGLLVVKFRDSLGVGGDYLAGGDGLNLQDL